MNLDLAKLEKLQTDVLRVAIECKYWAGHGAEGAEHLLHIEKMLRAALDKLDANEGKESEAVKADNSKEPTYYVSPDTMKPLTKANKDLIDCFSPTPSESCEQSETDEDGTVGWKAAMVMFAHGEDVQVKGGDSWWDLDVDPETVRFWKTDLYRRKPSPATPDYSLDQGFKEGDIIMVREMGGNWEVSQYLKYCNEKRPYPHHTLGGRCGSWTLARPLTKSEYEKVRHE